MRLIALAFAALLLPPGPVAGQTIESAYTTFNTEKCKHKPGKDAEEDYGSWQCPGYAGSPIRVAAGDQRMYISYGSSKSDDIALSQTLPGINSAYDGTVEWRIEKPATGETRPFATILRWRAMTEKDQENADGPIASTGRVLVVTRLGPDGTCHVGYVDAVANPDANDLARKIADENARTFRCGKDKRIVLGKTGDVPLPKDEP